MQPASSAKHAPGALRSPLPLLAGGILVALLLILAVTLPPRTAPPDASNVPTLSDGEVATLVAEQMRSNESALRVSSQAQVRFEDGAWLVTVGDARFRLSQRNRIVVPENDAARQLQFGGPTP